MSFGEVISLRYFSVGLGFGRVSVLRDRQQWILLGDVVDFDVYLNFSDVDVLESGVLQVLAKHQPITVKTSPTDVDLDPNMEMMCQC